MLKTKDGYEVKEGMWISSPDTVCEVNKIFDDKLYATEIIYTDDKGSYELGDKLTITKNDLHHYSYN